MHIAAFRLIVSSVLFVGLMSPLSADAATRGPMPTQVFMIPYDGDSTSMATQVGGLLEKNLKGNRAFRVVDLGRLLGGDPPETVGKIRENARKLLDSGIDAYGKVEFDAAVKDLKEAVALYQSQAAWVDRMPGYETALSYLAATYILMGESDDGRAVFKELLLYNKDYRIDPEKLDMSLQTIVDAVADRIKNGPVGSISVYSQPEGARIFIDGIERGFAPTSLERIPTGRHVIRLEHLGTLPYGDVIDVTPTEDRIVRAKLIETDEYKKIGIVVREVGKEIGYGKVGPAMVKLGQYVEIQWAFYGVVTHKYGEVTINAWIVDIPGQRRLASRRDNFPDADFGLDKNVDSFIEDLIKDAAKRQQTASAGGGASRSDDPLDRSSGMEDWWTKNKKKKRSLDVSNADITRSDSDDPLDASDGTEDW